MTIMNVLLYRKRSKRRKERELYESTWAKEYNSNIINILL